MGAVPAHQRECASAAPPWASLGELLPPPTAGSLRLAGLHDPPAPFGLWSLKRLLTLCAARRLHLAKFERAVLGLLLASNALGAPAAAPAVADSDKPREAAVDVSPPPPPAPIPPPPPSPHP